MAEPSSPAGLRIGKMHLRVPGGSPEDGRAVVRHVQEGLASAVPTRTESRSRADLRVSVRRGAGPDQIAAAILGALRERLG